MKKISRSIVFMVLLFAIVSVSLASAQIFPFTPKEEEKPPDDLPEKPWTNEELTEKIWNLTEQYDDLKAKYDALKKENGKLEDKYDDLKDDYDDLKDDYDDLKDTVDDLKDTVEEMG